MSLLLKNPVLHVIVAWSPVLSFKFQRGIEYLIAFDKQLSWCLDWHFREPPCLITVDKYLREQLERESIDVGSIITEALFHDHLEVEFWDHCEAKKKNHGVEVYDEEISS